jgi:hypothetical protein
MDALNHELIKHRELAFCSLHIGPEQARSAMLFLSDVHGIIHLDMIDAHRLSVSYDIRHLTLKLIEDALIELGFHLDNSLLFKLKRALYYYTEEVQSENMGCPGGPCTRNIFINRYSRLQHGCRDDRPDHWRKYL